MAPKKAKSVKDAVVEYEAKVEEVKKPVASEPVKAKRKPNAWASFCSSYYNEHYKGKPGHTYKSMLESSELKSEWVKHKASMKK